MTHTIALENLIETFRVAASQTINHQKHTSYHAYADALADGETLHVSAPGGYVIGYVTPSKDRTERATAAAKAFVEAVCTMDFNHEAFVDVITDLHRTHQQSVMRAMYAVMQGLAKENSDLRNEATVEFCKRVTNPEDRNFFPFI